MKEFFGNAKKLIKYLPSVCFALLISVPMLDFELVSIVESVEIGASDKV